jgi:hypothetical protein
MERIKMRYTTHDVVLKYQNRLNKSDSQDYDNLWWYQIEESFYKGMIETIRSLKQGKNVKQESDEETSDSVDNLQSLLKTHVLSFTNKDRHVECRKLPIDYLYFKRVSPKCNKGTCLNVQMKSYFREEANVDDLLIDFMTQPSFEMEQCFHTIAGNKIRIYHNNDFDIEEATLTYYATPIRPTFDRNKEEVIDFKVDLIELFIDAGIRILSGDIESLNQKALADERVEKGK